MAKKRTKESTATGSAGERGAVGKEGKSGKFETPRKSAAPAPSSDQGDA